MPKYKVFKKINSNNISTIPYESYADYKIDSSNYEDNGVVVSEGLYTSNIYKNDTLPINSSFLKPDEPMTDGGYYKRIVHDHIRIYYYNLDSYLHRSNDIDLFLYEKANILSIPHLQYGENLKEGSIKFESDINGTPYSFKDDENGNIVDLSIDTGSMVDPKFNFLYIGFEDKYNFKKYKETKSGKIFNHKNNVFNYFPVHSNELGSFTNLQFSDGVYLQTEVSKSGTKADFNGGGFIEINYKDIKPLKKDSDFSISLWGDFPLNQISGSWDEHVIVSNRYNETELYSEDGKLKYTKNEKLTYTYPYQIGIYNQDSAYSGKLYFRTSNGTLTSELTSSVAVNDSQKHIIFQKSGSYIQLYLDGEFDSEIISDFGDKINTNKSDIHIGSLNTTDYMFSGSLDEIRMYNKALTTDEIQSLANNDFYTGSLYQKNTVGNVFYGEGVILITSPMPKYNNVFFSGSNFTLDYQSTLTHYENNIICTLEQSEFNSTVNPSARVGETNDSDVLKSMVTSSNFHPYITDIGLYDDAGRLLVIGKLPHPVQKRSDINLNFLIKYDF